MFGFGGGFNGPGGGSTNSGGTSAPSGKTSSDKEGDRSVSGGGMSPSERNGQGKEGTNSGPGNPSNGQSGGKEYSGYGDREGQRAGPGNPGASGSAPGKGDRAGGGTTSNVGADSKEGDRSLSAGVDPSRFGGRSTPTGFGADAKEGDRSLSTGIDPSRFGPTRGFGAAMGEIDRAAQARAAERTSMDTYDRMAMMAGIDRFHKADLAETRRASEDRSMGVYNAAAANSAANATRADAASTARAAENKSVTDLENRRAALRNTIAGTESPDYNTIYGGAKFTSYDDHPRKAVTITSGPNKGKKSTAAGKYQMLASTWDRVATKLGLPDFSPKSQDIAADYLANEAYDKSKKGKHASLDAALAAGDVADVSKALAGTWTSLPGGIEQATTTSRFAGQYDQHLADLGTPKNIEDRPVTNSFASTYLGRPDKSGDTASAAPEDATPKAADYTPDPSLTQFPDRPRSNFEKVAAAGLDIGAGLIPGVGLGVGLVNGVLSLTGNRTIGERLVDAVATGGGKYTPGAPGDPNRRDYQVADSTVPSTTTVPTVEHFVDSYLNPPDATKYPTPYQKYDLGRDSYAGA